MKLNPKYRLLIIIISVLMVIVVGYFPHTIITTEDSEICFSLLEGIDYYLFHPEKPIKLDLTEIIIISSYFSVFLFPFWVMFFLLKKRFAVINIIGVLIHFISAIIFITHPIYGRIPSWSERGKEIAYSHTFTYFGIILIHFIIFFFLLLKTRKDSTYKYNN